MVGAFFMVSSHVKCAMPGLNDVEEYTINGVTSHNSTLWYSVYILPFNPRRRGTRGNY